ncbi:metalloregulator ArsR/SmtB family transcription factor [Yinghuangia soli]|uniref:Metalloregulator ArsR/SmtB family transcription factor n=1 Tax=Yinghuangia soli TaxID=2908204 RepID=A0AA41U464_9ACTN|nr:metalloregulator ArsR/SmtB family transcription factor [Yinghuangia soli]MCF2533458.1 metalloregulator ArsR/SmtB family transcription factor [Yinghuangia soli]
MDALLAALADPARWRLVGLLAERPRSVGVLAQLAEARQPQTTKHLQALGRAGVVTSQRTGQRRIYALESAPLRALAEELLRLADSAQTGGATAVAGVPGGPRATFDRYGLHLDAERSAADRPGWADGRTFRFHRDLPAAPGPVWRHLTEAPLLADWWTPEALRSSELVFEARPGGRIVQEYRDAEDTDGSDAAAGRAEGVVVAVRPGEHLSYRLSPLLPDGRIAFTAHLDFDLFPGPAGTAGTPAATGLDVRWRITDSTVESADFIAGIDIGFGQSLDNLATALAAFAGSATSPSAAQPQHTDAKDSQS